MANDDQGRLKNAVLTKFCYVAIALSAKAEQLHKSAAPGLAPLRTELEDLRAGAGTATTDLRQSAATSLG
jgi:hypothetical protein